MFKSIYYLMLIIGALLLPVSVKAGLVWENPRRDLKLTVETDLVTERFKFTNNGTKTVEITDLQSGCSCSELVASNKTIKPGESGYIDLTYKIGTKTLYNPEHQHISANGRITTSSRESYSIIATLILPSPLVRTPSKLVWANGEAATTKTFRFVAEKSLKQVDVSKLVNTNKLNFTMVFEKKTPREWLLHITPKITSSEMRVRAHFVATFVKDKSTIERHLSVLAVIDKPKH